MPAKATTDPLTLTFTKERETKGTWRYAEDVEDASQRPTIGTIYVLKTVLAEPGDPDKLTVTIQASVSK
jgi:hypothetical protein